MPSTQTRRQGNVRMLSVHQLAGTIDNRIRRYNKGTIELCDFFNCFPHARIAEIPLLSLIAFDWIKASRMTMLQDASCVANDEHCSHGLSFASLASNFDGQVDDDLKCI